MVDTQIGFRDKGEVFLSGYNKFVVRRTGVLTGPFPKLGAQLEIDEDLRPLFPFINSCVDGAEYFDNPERIRFVFEGVLCNLYSREIIAAAFTDHDHAVGFGEHLLEFLNNIFTQRHTIRPDYRKVKALSALEIYKILPGTNCGECGLPSCLAFAGALSKGKAATNQCPGMGQPIEAKAVYPVIDKEGRMTGTVELDLTGTDHPTHSPQENIKSLLTARELEVLALLAQGHTNPEISRKLFISPHTVKSHVVHIYEKLGVNDRTQAAVVATRHNLI